jgi:predicted DNA-binding protein
MTDSRISVRLDPETTQRLKEMVRRTGKKESEVVREALATYLENQPNGESCLDVARRHGIIGCAKSLPADLSTNRDHFEGFGR